MNRIALLTIHDTLNFGSLLQTFSLYSAIEKLGYDITLLDYKNEAIMRRESTYRLSDVRTIKELYKAIFHHGFLERKHSCFWEFIRNRMKISESYDSKTINESNADYDTFIVGSDIVWGMEITGSDLNYMLQFVNDDKTKLAFSSSVGKRWPKEMDSKIGKLLSRFDRITVREQLAVEWIKEIAPNVDVCETCDPTMLWKRNFWEQFCRRNLAPSCDYILTYLTTDDKRTVKDAINYGKKHHLPVYYINYGHCIPGVRNIRPTTVEQWISLFAYANTVFTASYHGILFALYFQRPLFWQSRANPARTESLSKELGIQDREGITENYNKDGKMDYKKIDSLIQTKRDDSWKVLESMLSIKNRIN